MVVNQIVKGGWLEFLGLIDSQVQEFDEPAALAETNATAAFNVISHEKSKEKGKEESKEKPKEASAPLPVPAPPFEEVEEDATRTEAAKGGGKDGLIRVGTPEKIISNLPPWSLGSIPVLRRPDGNWMQQVYIYIYII